MGKKTLLGFAFAALLAASTGPATADPYRWRAHYGLGDAGGASNCGFVTLDQCQATVSGIGGYCEINQFYTGPEQRPAKLRRRHSAG